jgi:hypothetical protein
MVATNATMSVRPTKPPRTPPTIGPTLDFFLELGVAVVVESQVWVGLNDVADDSGEPCRDPVGKM